MSPARPRVQPAFRPSRHAFAFANTWPPVPAVVVRTPAGQIGLGNAERGLCGGMVLAALDYWRAGQPPPAGQPAPGSPLFRFLVRRLIESWRLPAGVARYYRGMVSSDRALAAATIGTQWPRARALLDAGQPAALGVITVASASPFLLGRCHQVLAYGYAVRGGEVTLAVYDPNSGPDDGVAIRFAAGPAAADGPAFRHNIGIGWPVRGFFVTRYAPAAPPAG